MLEQINVGLEKIRKLGFDMSAVPEDMVQEVVEFLEGERQGFSVEVLELAAGQVGTEFQRAVWSEITKIPWGEVRTYGEVAVGIGRPLAVRAVGTACGRNKCPLVVPCHRVVSSGGIGGYGYGGVEIKRELLRREGVTFE